jgi:hypothetical protein
MSLKTRLNKLEQGEMGDGCPACAAPLQQIQIVEGTLSDEPAAPGGGHCQRCGRQLPIRHVVFIRPDQPG